MFKTAQCQQCLHTIYPPKEVCPFCYATEFQLVADQLGRLVDQVKNVNQDKYICLVQTKSQVLVLTESEQALHVGQPILIQIDNKKLLSIPFEETNHEKKI